MPFRAPFTNSTFSLDISSLAGFLGADAALAVMMLPHLHAQRKWWGWYNCPGSYYLAKRYGQLARFNFWSPLYRPSAVPRELAVELGGVMRPTFTSSQSGAILQRTGPLAPMLVDECGLTDAIVVIGRLSEEMDVTIVHLEREPSELEHPRVPHTHYRCMALFPMAATLSAAIVSAYYRDRYSASVILLGALCHGIACVVMGDAKFIYQHRIPHQAACLASGWLEAPKAFIVLCGTEAAVAPVTRGRFSLEFENSKAHCAVTACSILLGLQFLLQLILVPAGTLFGQVMFIASLLASWAYHRLILADDKESVQRGILMTDILGGPQLQKYRFGTRTAAAVFAILALRPAIGPDIKARLRAVLPSDTPVWQLWDDIVARRILSGQSLHFTEERSWEWQKMRGLSTLDESLLFVTLLQDAEDAYVAFQQYPPRTVCSLTTTRLGRVHDAISEGRQ
ncbi:hypothetical protein OH77DRAFT_1388795 [Trametes cingulata]|nr:hypothetical protein OH77DRAFT_1388795 [Trametes cingulata]